MCVLLDVSTRPRNNSILRLWKSFDVNSNVGGACGEIAVYKGKNWKYLLNPLGPWPPSYPSGVCVLIESLANRGSAEILLQNQNIIDKPTKSMFGYISVLVSKTF